MPESRQLVVTENISANGVIEFVDDWFDPADQDDADGFNDSIDRGENQR